MHVYTDGSYDPHMRCQSPLQHGPSPSAIAGWTTTLPACPQTSSSSTQPTSAAQLLVGASIAATSGVYPAELQAIARALAAFPLPCSLHIHSDSQAAIAGIRSYSAELNSRQRLRMAARPLLQLIHHQIEQRKAAGGSVELEHVRAHSTAADIHSVGNRLTDYKANTARARPQSATPSTLRELPLAECEHHLTAWTELGNGQQVIDDVRRTAIAQLKAQQLERWRHQPAADTMDGTFAGPALLDTSRVVLTHGSPTQQAAILHIATNSIQCCWQLQADGSTRKVQPLWCAPCDAALTLSISRLCPDHVVFRSSQRAAVLAVLSSDAHTDAWLQDHRHLPLAQLLVELFPTPPAHPPHLHIAHIMCGVFSARQANAACKVLGLARAKDGRSSHAATAAVLRGWRAQHSSLLSSKLFLNSSRFCTSSPHLLFCIPHRSCFTISLASPLSHASSSFSASPHLCTLTFSAPSLLLSESSLGSAHSPSAPAASSFRRSRLSLHASAARSER